jgi:hypothetical protein
MRKVPVPVVLLSMVVSFSVAQPFTWNGSVNSDWTVAANWTPDRTSPSTVDDLIFNATGANRNITNVPTQTVGSILVTGNVSYSFAPATAGNSLNLGLTSGNALQIDNGSTLTVGTGLAALNINAPTGGVIEIGGQINLVNGNLAAGNATLTLHTNPAPLARTSGQVSANPSTVFNFGNSSNTGGANMVLPDNIFVSAPTISSLTVNRTNGVTFGNQSVTVNSGVTLTLGDLTTNGTGRIRFASTAADPSESTAGKIVGWADMALRAVGTGAIDFLGFSVAAGANDIGSMTITRRTGPGGINTFNANQSIAASWDVEVTTQPAAGRDVVFRWLPAFDNVTLASNRFQPYLFGNGPGWTPFGTLQTLTATTPLRQTAAASTTDLTDTFTVTDESQVLPVELLFFAAAVEKNQVVCTWATASELNTLRFEVERSANGADFVSIGSVAAVGNSRQRNNYSFADAAPMHGRAFYRLVSIDADGFTERFRVVAVDYRGEASAVVYPNPVADKQMTLRLSFTPAHAYAVSVTDTRGLEVARFQAAEPLVTLPLDVPAGVYIVRIAGDSFSQVVKIVVL